MTLFFYNEIILFIMHGMNGLFCYLTSYNPTMKSHKLQQKHVNIEKTFEQ